MPIIEEHNTNIWTTILEKSFETFNNKTEPKIISNENSIIYFEPEKNVRKIKDLKLINEIVETVVTTTAYPDEKKDAHFSFTVVSKVYPYNFKEQNTKKLIDRVNVTVCTEEREKLMDVGWNVISVRTEIYDLIKNESLCPEKACSISSLKYRL